MLFMLQRSRLARRVANTTRLTYLTGNYKYRYSNLTSQQFLHEQRDECSLHAKKKRVVFLGTPAVAVTTLTHLLEASRREDR